MKVEWTVLGVGWVAWVIAASSRGTSKITALAVAAICFAVVGMTELAARMRERR